MKITESVYSDHLTRENIDRDNGVIRNVKIIGKQSKNGYIYSDKALMKAVPLYENKKINVDHPKRGDEKVERGFLESTGWLANVKFQDDGLYGDYFYIKSHPAAEPILEWAERNPKAFGLSHNADGQMNRRDKVVELIDSVRSVDIVGSPATTAGLYESVREKPKMQTTLKKLVASHGSEAHKTNLKAFFEQEKPDNSVKLILESEFEMDEPEEGAAFAKLLTESTKTLAVSLMESDATPEERGVQVKAISLAESFIKDGLPSLAPSGDVSELEKLRAENAALKRKESARKLIESKGIEATDILVEAVSRFEKPSEQETLLESFKAPGGALPRKSPPKGASQDNGEVTWESLAKSR